MPASTDKLRYASGSTEPVVTSLALNKANGADTAELQSATGWNTITGVDVIIYRRQLNTTTGQYEKIAGTQTEWVGTLTGTTLAGLSLKAGTEPADGYAADGNTVVMCGPTAQWGDDVIETMLTLFNQDQTLKAGPIQTALGLGAGSLNGWNALGFAPSSVTYNGNRSYDLTFTSQDLTGTLSPGMRLRTTRTVAAPTQCASLDGSTQYFNKTSPAGMTFTDDFVAGAWVKLTSYPSGAGAVISRWNGTSGWRLVIINTGQVQLTGFNASSSNNSYVLSNQSVPLNKWVHIAAQLDMSAFTATTTTSYIMMNGLDIPVTVARNGTSPTSFGIAGNLEIGSDNSGADLFTGKIAQAFISSAKITQANVRTLISQGLTSTLISSNSIVSAYSLSNSLSDLNTTNANNLTANGSAVTTNADAPFGSQGDDSHSTTLDYAIIQKAVFSTNTTLTVQVPEGCTIPTSGGVTSVVYSSAKAPYGMPNDIYKWAIEYKLKTQSSQVVSSTSTWYNHSGMSLSIPIGKFNCQAIAYAKSIVGTSSNYIGAYFALSTSSSALSDDTLVSGIPISQVSQQESDGTFKIEGSVNNTAATTYYILTQPSTVSGVTTNYIDGRTAAAVFRLFNAYL